MGWVKQPAPTRDRFGRGFLRFKAGTDLWTCIRVRLGAGSVMRGRFIILP